MSTEWSRCILACCLPPSPGYRGLLKTFRILANILIIHSYSLFSSLSRVISEIIVMGRDFKDLSSYK